MKSREHGPNARSGIALAVLGLCFAAPPAWAAEEAEGERIVEEIVVTGFRSSLNASLELKRSEVAAVDAIVAEDIADFPDLNLAEALQRIPGVTIRREAGEGRNITVRGLGPNFTRVRVNGMEGLGTTGGTDASGGANRGRQFDFNIFASELFNTILVRKTQEAEVDEGSLGATVDLRTARPFDYGPGVTAVFSGQALYNDLSEDVNPRVSGLLSNVWADGRVGGLIAVAYTEREILEEGFSTVRWQDNPFASCSGCADAAEFAAVNETFHPRIPRYGRLTHDQERLGVNGALQFFPTDRTEIVLEGLYGTFQGTRREQFLEAIIRNNEDEMDVADFVIENDLLVAGTFNNAFVRIENRIDELDTDFYQVTLSANHEFSDRFRGDVLLGTSESDYQNPVQNTIIFDNNGGTYSYDFRDDLNLPMLDYGFNVADPGAYTFTEFRDRPNSVVNTYDTLQVNLEYDFSDRLWLSGGVNWKEYQFDVAEARRESTTQIGSPDCPGCETVFPVTPDIANILSGFGDGIDNLPSGIPTSWVTPDIDAANALIDLQSIPATRRDGDVRNVKEENLGGYVQLNWSTEVGADMLLRGNAGIRVVRTDQESTGILNGSPVTTQRDYTDTLPAINLALDVTDEVVLRAAYAQVMARPNLGDLTPGGNIALFGDPELSFGNPLLDPFEADAFDLAAEWYFADESAATIAFFYKDIESFPARITETGVPFDELGLPASVLDGGANSVTDLWSVTRNTNGNGGDLQGVELIFQTTFSNLPGLLSNTGLLANYTYVDSDVDFANPGEPADKGELTFLSKHSYNVTIWYEDERFGARLSGAYRDEFKIRHPDRWVDESFHLDFASSYQINDRLEITFEAINLTDEFFNQRYIAGGVGPNLPYVYHHTGRNFFIGARWQL